MKNNFKNSVFLLTLAFLFLWGKAFASAPAASQKKTDVASTKTSDAGEVPQDRLEFLSLGEYWGVRTDIDAAQGGNGERQIIDLQYDWDDALSASKEEEAFSKAEKAENALRNAQEP